MRAGLRHDCSHIAYHPNEQAEEVGPHTDHAGPATVKLHHVTLARPAFEAWLQGCVIEWAIMRVYWARDMSSSKEVGQWMPVEWLFWDELREQRLLNRGAASASALR